MKNVILAFLFAPAAPFLVYLLLGSGFPFFIMALLLGLPIAYAVTLVGGVPLYRVVKTRPRWQRGRYYALFAGLTGMGGGFLLGVLIAMSKGDDVLGALIGGALIFGIVGLFHGAVSGYVFWCIVRPSNSKMKHNPVVKEELDHAKTY